MTSPEFIGFLRKNVICVTCLVVSVAIGVTIYLRNGLLPEAEKVLSETSKQGELMLANIEDAHQLKEQHVALVSANQAIANRMIHVGQLAENLQYFYRLYLRNGLLPAAEKVLSETSKQGELMLVNIEDAHQLKEQHVALVSANQAIANRMIHVGQLAENLQYFYRLESETSTKLTDPRQMAWNPPPKNMPKTTYTPVGFAITAQGTYPQLVGLLRRLENGEHYCRVISCNLKPVAEQRGSPLTTTLDLELLGIQ